MWIQALPEHGALQRIVTLGSLRPIPRRTSRINRSTWNEGNPIVDQQGKDVLSKRPSGAQPTGRPVPRDYWRDRTSGCHALRGKNDDGGKRPKGLVYNKRKMLRGGSWTTQKGSSTIRPEPRAQLLKHQTLLLDGRPLAKRTVFPLPLLSLMFYGSIPLFRLIFPSPFAPRGAFVAGLHDISEIVPFPDNKLLGPSAHGLGAWLFDPVRTTPPLYASP